MPDSNDDAWFNAVNDPAGAVDYLGAEWSPDFGAYASGQLNVTQIRCLLCGQAPCKCRQCSAVVHNRYYLATGRPEYEICDMTIGPDGVCPRGHRTGSES